MASAKVTLVIAPSELDMLRKGLEALLENRKAEYRKVPANRRSYFALRTNEVVNLLKSLEK
jgi:hypothetical protein